MIDFLESVRQPSLRPVRPVRPLRIMGAVAIVPLTRGYEAVIDSCDIDLVGQFNWRVRVAKAHILYGVRYVWPNTTQHLHQLIIPAPPDFMVDHINGDGLDNRRANLRIASRAQNRANSRLPVSNTSGFKGAFIDSSTGRWKSVIKCGGQYRHRGCFATKEEAHEAYAQALKQYYGEFARVA